MLAGKHIILGITGGIAAYKCAYLVRDLVKAGADVQVVMTESATQFITPLTLATLSRRSVVTGMFPPAGAPAEGPPTRHIDLALWADVMLVAPASANTIAKFAHGLADNFLTTLVLALRCPLALAPSMDADMYLNEITQENLRGLRESGCLVLEPESGELASGLTGPGRLPEVDRLVKFLDDVLEKVRHDLAGRKVLVTAGPTQEPIDPVRFLSNRSSGKMGFAVANAAAQRGGDVTLVSGPVHLRTPRNVRRIDVTTAREMQEAVEQEFPGKDLVIMSAAVADFAPARVAAEKIKRSTIGGEGFSMEMRKNPDILQSLGKRKAGQVLVGFALETENGVARAKEKLSGKGLDAIVLNDPGEEGAGFEVDTNVVTFIRRDGSAERLPKMPKYDIAHEILNRVVPLLK